MKHITFWKWGLGLSLAIPGARGDEYHGNVGGLEATFNLDWDAAQNVTGSYFYPKTPGTTYRLTGRNSEKGKLYLEEFTGSELTAKCSLSKSLTGDHIVWSGRMQNTDGRAFEMRFSRSREPATSDQGIQASAPGDATYSGHVGRMKAEFSLTWKPSGEVTGSYAYPSRPGVRYRLVGKKTKEGGLYLQEFAGKNLSARCYLDAGMASEGEAWTGRMENTDGRTFDMALSRQRREPEAKEKRSAPGIEREIVWSHFPKANSPVDMVPVSWGDSVTRHSGKITAYEETDQGTTMRFKVGIGKPWEEGGIRYEGPEITLRVGCRLPFTPQQMIEDSVGFYCDAEGKVVDLHLHAIAITHWRESDSGKIEIRGVLSSPDLDDLHLLSAAERARIIRAQPTISFVPDKLPPESLSADSHIFRTIRLTAQYGLTVQMTDAGPGGLELEGISLEAESPSVPWMMVGDPKRVPVVPPSQSTGEAG